MEKKCWKNFNGEFWRNEISVENFIQKNYTEYFGNDQFLSEATNRTNQLWAKCRKLIQGEIESDKCDVEVEKLSGINNFSPGYIDRDNEIIVGLQSSYPLRKVINPYGGIRMVKSSLREYNFKGKIQHLDNFEDYRKSHNQGVFDVYTDEIRKARSAGLLTGLPDAYGRGRIIGDYRRVALYGINRLIEEKEKDLKKVPFKMNEENIRLREEIKEQIRALNETKEMAFSYGIDISKPAENANEAVQFIYFGYLAGTKESNGAAMSLGRVSTFIDIYIERDFKSGLIDEKTAQEIIDQFVIKLRMIRHLRTPEYNELFAGDPNWITEAIGGVSENGKSLVTKSSYRFINTLKNLEPSPEPNITVLWSKKLPANFKNYCSKMSIISNSLQYENDDLMRPVYGHDYGIACCVSAMDLGKQMQFFGARCNLAKALLYSINGGIDEITGEKILDGVEKIDEKDFNFENVIKNYHKVLEIVAELYVNTMNVIHYMHDKYAYERIQMALHESQVKRTMAFGVAGLSVAADSLSAIKSGVSKPVYENGIAVDFKLTGDYPKFGNDDDFVDDLAVEILKKFSFELKNHKTYRDAKHTLSVLTITSNVVYGKKTGSTPDGRKSGEPFAPGANPMHGRDRLGALASLNSVAKIPYREVCEDGISNTFTIVPEALGNQESDRISNLSNVLEGYFSSGAHHINVNVLNRELLIDAVDKPHLYPSLTIRVSGYAVNFNRLTREQKLEVISRTFHKGL